MWGALRKGLDGLTSESSPLFNQTMKKNSFSYQGLMSKSLPVSFRKRHEDFLAYPYLLTF